MAVEKSFTTDLEQKRAEQKTGISPELAAAYENAACARVVILRLSDADPALQESINKDYKKHLAAHIEFVLNHPEAKELVSGIHARRGVDEHGQTVFATVFLFKSVANKEKYESEPLISRMRKDIFDRAFPDLKEGQKLGYEPPSSLHKKDDSDKPIIEQANHLLTEKGIKNLKAVQAPALAR